MRSGSASRLDVGFDFDLGSEFAPDRIFKTARNLMCGGEGLRAVDLQIGRDRQTPANGLYPDMVNGKTKVARDHHHPFPYGLAVERFGLGCYGEFGCRHIGADRPGQLLFDGSDAIKRKRAADADA
jgi:hypothetical protein